MTSTTDKLKGVTNVAIGGAKQGLGKAAGNPRVEAEGAVQKATGKVQKAVGDAKSAVKKAIDRT